MIAENDPAIKEAVALVMELNEDDRERLLAHDRWKWEMDQAALRRQSYREGKAAAEAIYQPVIAEKDRSIEEKDREIEGKDRSIEEKDREIEELRRKLREAGRDN
jgi:predicted RNase H-like nuclease (RuvC/YqgF family)